MRVLGEAPAAADYAAGATGAVGSTASTSLFCAGGGALAAVPTHTRYAYSKAVSVFNWCPFQRGLKGNLKEHLLHI